MQGADRAQRPAVCRDTCVAAPLPDFPLTDKTLRMADTCALPSDVLVQVALFVFGDERRIDEGVDRSASALRIVR